MPKKRYLNQFSIYVILLLSVHTSYKVQAQWQIIDVGTKSNMRAVQAISPTICWIGGSNGTILKTQNGGKTWITYRVPHADSLDFRDIHVFDKQNALAMSAGLSQDGKAKIFRTEDGGEHWNIVYETSQVGVFLDGMAFWDKNTGICQGDPIEGRFFVLKTMDGGKTWQELPVNDRPLALPNEASFAASGTSLVANGKGEAYIGTGGAKFARIIKTMDYGKTWTHQETPLEANATSGIFGLHFWSKNNGIAVGGDYKATSQEGKNVLTTIDGGESWQLQSATKPAGLKECVQVYHKTNKTWNGSTQIRSDNKALVAVGPSGSSFSLNHGSSWIALGTEAFHAVSFAGNTGYAVGGSGLIGKIKIIPSRRWKKKTY